MNKYNLSYDIHAQP